MKKLSIIIPVYNEEKFVTLLLDKVLAVHLLNKLEKEIIIIDDASTDKTNQIIQKYINQNSNYNFIFYKQEKNCGKGAAIHKGIEIATGDIIIIQDADLEYNPNEYNRVIKPILDGYADVVYGSRFIGSQPHRILYYWHRAGNSLLTWLSNVFSNLNLTDMETCYKAFRAEIIKSIPLKEKRFGFEPEVTAKIAKIKGIRIYEVGISYYGRTYADGKKINWKDGFRALWVILKYNIFN
ncbi:MAG: glycosyltransferase family 2 protein [Bacteroidales bacterium]|nr:glycosyltransferase family 2 protein [Bacteroidales bacterium]